MVRNPLTPEERERGKRLGALLRGARGELTLAVVAKRSGLPSETLRKIEAGRIAGPSFFTVAAIAGALGVSLDRIADLCPLPEAAVVPPAEWEWRDGVHAVEEAGVTRGSGVARAAGLPRKVGVTEVVGATQAHGMTETSGAATPAGSPGRAGMTGAVEAAEAAELTGTAG